MVDRKTVGERLRKLRGSRSMREVAAACGVGQPSISMYESGDRMPSDAVKVALAKYYNRSVQSIFFAG